LTEPFHRLSSAYNAPAGVRGALMIAVLGIDDAPKIAIIFPSARSFPLVPGGGQHDAAARPGADRGGPDAWGRGRRQAADTRVGAGRGVLPNVYKRTCGSRLGRVVGVPDGSRSSFGAKTSGHQLVLSNQQGKVTATHFDKRGSPAFLVIGLIGLVTDPGVAIPGAGFLFPVTRRSRAGRAVGVVLMSVGAGGRGCWLAAHG